jgi:cysteate synthase
VKTRYDHYALQCVGCAFRTEDDHTLLHCPACGRGALLRSAYLHPLQLRGSASAIFSYRDWLPVGNPYGFDEPRVACLRADSLGQDVGLRDLWVLLSGTSPAHEATMRTGSFKETEAIGILSRVKEQSDKTLIISSAGNAGRAFLDLGASRRCPVVIVVPDSGEPLLRLLDDAGEDGPLLIVIRDAYYMDAIRFVDQAIEAFPSSLIREGGCYNVARRDAMGIPFLAAAHVMQSLPDRYVQAVGSGTGAIAAWEGSVRLIEHGVLPPRQMRLHLVQNAPFTPMVDAWRSGKRDLIPWPKEEVHERLSQTYASVLSNATPPYAVKGGVFDALSKTGGTIDSVTNDQIRLAEERVTHHLKVRPCPAASTAAAGLIQAVERGEIDPDERVLLHLTGTSLDDLGGRTSYKYGRRRAISTVDEGLEAIHQYLSHHDHTVTARA